MNPVRLGMLLILCTAVPIVPQARGADRSGEPFDHVLSGFPLTGAHQRIGCESCHRRGVFDGTPTRCGECHGGSGVRTAGGMPRNHVPSSSECGDCHVTSDWTVALFDHAGVSAACESCHNGTTATGRSARHVPSHSRCGDCHGTLAWTPARFRHSDATGSCASCHNGAIATGMPRNHIATSGGCENCHTTASWRARFDHASVTGNCASCHDGSTATGMRRNHFATSLDCSACHDAAAWVPDRFRHSSPDHPGQHRGNLDCRDCHGGGSQTVVWTFGAYRPDCAGCHAGDFRPGPHKKVKNPTILYTVGELRDCTGACHEYTDASMTAISKSRNGKHSVARGGW